MCIYPWKKAMKDIFSVDDSSGMLNLENPDIFFFSWFLLFWVKDYKHVHVLNCAINFLQALKCCVKKKKKRIFKTNRQGYFQQKLHSCCLNTSCFFLKEVLTVSSKSRCHSPLWTFGGKRRSSKGSLPRKSSSQTECCWLNSHREVLTEAFWSRHGNCSLCACSCLFFILMFGSLLCLVFTSISTRDPNSIWLYMVLIFFILTESLEKYNPVHGQS